MSHQGCDIIIQNKNGNSALHLAVTNPGAKVATLLIQSHQCDPTLTNMDGNTPLHLACKNADKFPGILEVARLLVSNPVVDPSCVNNAGHTPIELTNNFQLIQDIYQFTEKKTKHSVQTYIKLFIVGNPATGKSTLVEAICKEATKWRKLLPGPWRRVNKVPPQTAGIIPTSFQSKIFGNTILYDLAGQYEYYSSHAAVIENAIIGSPSAMVIVVDLSEDHGKILEKLTY